MPSSSPSRSPLLLPLVALLLTFQVRCKAYTPIASPHRWSASTPAPVPADGAAAASTATASDNETRGDAAEEENIKTRDLLSLDYIRSTLIRQEETIIFALIERAQFRQNDVVYEVGGVPGLGVPPGSLSYGGGANGEEEEELSFLDFMLIGTVQIRDHSNQPQIRLLGGPWTVPKRCLRAMKGIYYVHEREGGFAPPLV